ncbi:hypothetical protein CO669_06500 [Bradyrhizobium sp. Y36]|uniref:MauE/DoxX family redox-associated membrane protein n=1 Tax=Bradyrhizobium sp. Y36 TaxID=2035447 RepID=UPI000BEBC101|nr:MauE/DoxX family redox-associated membrane protein [Bradyrhizobium sp. Y36]PDT91636.1 hypothetical protein CO669_06500 [Bradyrhizobium sp. Y36]
MFDRIGILVLSIEWIVFGSMHFSMTAETIRMIPNWVPDAYKPMVGITSGMLEVTIGVLVLVPLTRKWAAAVSLFLLIAYIPAVYQILAHDADFAGGTLLQTSFRVAIVPNNVFLGICSVYLLMHPEASLTSPATTRRPSIDFGQAGLAILLIAILLLMSNCAGFLAITFGPQGNRGTAYLWAMMCIATGALVGFLFAVPRVNPSVPSRSALVANTNIEQVSDWLTKILVGVGLINFRQIGGFIDGLAVDLAQSLGTQAAPVGKPFALSLIVYFFVVGLIQGYLLTRLFLSRQFGPPEGVTP